MVERLWQLLDDYDPRLRLYVYWLQDHRKVKPALLIGSPFPDLLTYLHNHYGIGNYCMMMRRGKKLELSCAVDVEVPTNWNGLG